MKNDSHFVVIKILCLICIIAFAVSVNSYGKNLRKQKDISEKTVYAALFYQIVNYEKSAENASDVQGKNFFFNYFKNEAQLNEYQFNILKTAAYNFTSAYSLTHKNKRLKLFYLTAKN